MCWEDGCDGMIDGEANGAWWTLNDEKSIPFLRNDSCACFQIPWKLSRHRKLFCLPLVAPGLILLLPARAEQRWQQSMGTEDKRIGLDEEIISIQQLHLTMEKINDGASDGQGIAPQGDMD